jgi:hypothetical protein
MEELMDRMQKFLRREGGRLMIATSGDNWLVGVEFGQEADDSDMAGGAAYASESSITDALEYVLGEVGA